jgi:hypothetical protein
MTNNNEAHDVVHGPVAGEAIKDAARWPGYTLLAIGLLAFALSLTALAVGRIGPPLIVAVVAAVAFLAAGLGWQFAERRRLRKRLPGGTPERPEDAAPLT